MSDEQAGQTAIVNDRLISLH